MESAEGNDDDNDNVHYPVEMNTHSVKVYTTLLQCSQVYIWVKMSIALKKKKGKEKKYTIHFPDFWLLTVYIFYPTYSKQIDYPKLRFSSLFGRYERNICWQLNLKSLWIPRICVEKKQKWHRPLTPDQLPVNSENSLSLSCTTIQCSSLNQNSHRMHHMHQKGYV